MCWSRIARAGSRPRAGLSEVPQHGRICVRPPGRTPTSAPAAAITQTSGRRAVHAGHRPAAAGAAGRRAGRRARGADRGAARPAQGDRASSIHVTFANADDARRARRRPASLAGPASSSISSTRATPISTPSSPRSPRASARSSSASGATRWATTSRSIWLTGATSNQSIGTRSSPSTWTPARANGAGPT
jgi:hypothetical protein